MTWHVNKPWTQIEVHRDTKKHSEVYHGPKSSEQGIETTQTTIGKAMENIPEP